MEKKISRRKFLKKGLLITTATAVTVCGGTALAATYKPVLENPSNTYGENTMDQKILVTYASKAGSTIEIANRVGELIAERGNAVDVIPVKEVTDLSVYQAVVLGSAIRIGSILPAAMQFVEQNQELLKNKPLNVFVACMTLNEETEENRTIVSAYLDPVRALIQPESEGLFAGVMDLDKLNLIERLMMKSMETPVGDFRNWDQINNWAQQVTLN